MGKPIALVVRCYHLNNMLTEDQYVEAMGFDKLAFAGTLVLYAIEAIYKAPHLYVDGNTREKVELDNRELLEGKLQEYAREMQSWRWFDQFRPRVGLNLGTYDTARRKTILANLREKGVQFEYMVSEDDELFERSKERITYFLSLPPEQQKRQEEELANAMEEDSEKRDEWLLEKVLSDGAEMNVLFYGFAHDMIPFSNRDRINAYSIDVFPAKEPDRFIAKGALPALSSRPEEVHSTLTQILDTDPIVKVIPQITFY